MQEFGIPVPGAAAATQDKPDNSQPPALDMSDTSDESLEARIQRLTAMDDDKGAQPNAQAKPDPNAAQPAPKEGDKPGQQPAAAADPDKAFAEASGKAFFSDTGELNTQKINDFYLTNGKSFLKYAEAPAAAVENPPSPLDKAGAVDPEKEYAAKVGWVVENFAKILEDQKTRGFDDASALVNIQQYLASLVSERANKIELRKTIEEEAKRFAPEFESARKERMAAAVDRNIAELSAPLNDLIPGVDGRQALNQLILSKRYGGETLDYMFRKDNPGCEKLPEKERNELARTWFGKFQQDKQAMAHVAEFGRLRWMAENFKPILEHAQKVGAAKVLNGKEAGQGAPSSLGQPQKAPGNSALEQFFGNGMDSVN